MLSIGVTVAKDVKCKVYPKNWYIGNSLNLMDVLNLNIYHLYAIFVVEPAAPRQKELIETRRDNETNGLLERQKHHRILVMIALLRIVELLSLDHK